MDNEEIIAKQLHEWYLEATDQEGAKYNSQAKVDYEDLPEGSKLLDRYIAKKVIEIVNLARADERAKVIKEINSLSVAKYMDSGAAGEISVQIN